MKVYEKILQILSKNPEKTGEPFSVESPTEKSLTLTKQARLLLIAKVFQTCDAMSIADAMIDESDEFINKLNEIALRASDDTYYGDLIRLNKNKYNA